MQTLTNDRLEELRKAFDLKTEITYWTVNGSKAMTSVTYSSEKLQLTVTESFTYDLDNDITVIQLS